MSSLHDEKILEFLDERNPANFDDFMSAIGDAFAEIMPSIERIVCSYGNNFDADEVISRGIEVTLVRLHQQYLSGDTNFAFTRDHGLSFQSWVLQNIGRPGTGAKSGVIGDAIKRETRERARIVVLDEIPAGAEEASSDTEDTAIEQKIQIELLAIEVGQLSGAEQFVLRGEYALHDHEVMVPSTIEALAVSSKLPKAEIAKIRRRAQNSICSDSKRLTQSQIAILLDISTRQVRNIKTRALKALKESSRLGKEDAA